jgi:hypothetical protein
MILPCTLSQKSSLTHVLNLIEAIDLTLNSKLNGKFIFNVSDQKIYDLNNVFRIIMLNKIGFFKTLILPKLLINFILIFTNLLKIKSKINSQSISYLHDESILSNKEITKQLNYKGEYSFEDWKI